MIHKVNFEEYAHSFSQEKLEDFRHGRLSQIHMGTMRELLYGYTFTPEYASGEIDDALSVDYWEELLRNGDEAHDCVLNQNPHTLGYVKTEQAKMLLLTILLTGDGETPEKAFCVISVAQEYEFMKYIFPYRYLKMKRQVQLIGKGIDCIEFEPNVFQVDKLYFDYHRYKEAMVKH